MVSHVPDISLLLVNVPAEQWRARISVLRQRVGAGSRAEIVIPEPALRVDELHAEVWVDRASAYIFDLGSRSGTFVNGIPLPPHQSLRILPGDMIALGRAKLEVVGPRGRRMPLPPDYWENLQPLPEEDRGEEDRGSVMQQSDETSSALSRLRRLSPAEYEVVMFMHRGLISDAALSQALGRGRNTIRTHLASIFAKLSVHSRVQLTSLILRLSETRDLRLWADENMARSLTAPKLSQ
jgi:DNA-binding CsgD family transcriptional regulator